MKNSLLTLIVMILTYLSASSQVCVSVKEWSLASDNGDGTCTYDFVVEVDSGNGATGTATFTVDGVLVHTEPSCTCNPATISFPVTVACGATIDIEANYDAPGNGNDCSGTTGAIALPVEWVSLSVSKEKYGNKLNWSVIEFENEKFVIQNSEDGQKFDDIDEILSSGISYQKNHYEYLHLDPSTGTNYYRIMQLDIDGNYSYSDIVSIDNREFDQLASFPNPFQDRIFIQSVDSKKWSISDSFGRVVMTGFSNEILTDHLLSGMYYLSIHNLEKVTTQTLLKI